MFEQPKPNGERAKLAIIFMYVAIAQACITLLFNIAIYFAKTNHNFDQLQAVTIANGLFSLIAMVGSILTIVFFIQWFRRAYFNLHVMGCKNLEHTEGWAAGAWFVPIMNYIWPYGIMKEIWNETQKLGRHPNEQYEHKSGEIVGWWWLCWVASAIIAVIGAFSNLGKRPQEISETFYLFSIVSNLFSICAGVFVIMTMRSVREFEEELKARYQNFLTQQYQQNYQQQIQNQNMQNPGNTNPASYSPIPPPVQSPPEPPFPPVS